MKKRTKNTTFILAKQNYDLISNISLEEQQEEQLDSIVAKADPDNLDVLAFVIGSALSKIYWGNIYVKVQKIVTRDTEHVKLLITITTDRFSPIYSL